MNKISIVTATYNSGKTIKDTLESVLNQSYKNYELIVKDGGSKDNTLDICREYEQRFKGRIKIISSPDKGIYDAMNQGVGMATGDIVGILNSDDFYTADDILITVANTFDKEPTIDAVYGDDSTIVSIDGEKVVSDKGQKLKMLDFIVGLHETLQDVMKGFINQSKNDNTYEEELDTFLKYDEKFFRSLLCINLVDQIHALFLDFNKAMQQSKGEPGPATNFILNDLKRVVGFLKFENEHADKEDEGFKKAYDASFLMLQYMEGSKKAEDEGTTIKDQIVEARKLWQVEIGKNEPEWRTRYQILWDKLVAFEQEEAAKRRAQ